MDFINELQLPSLILKGNSISILCYMDFIDELQLPGLVLKGNSIKFLTISNID